MESVKNKTALESIKDNLPLLSIALATISLLRLILYYKYFGVNIIDYIELTEALTLSMPVFIYLGLGGGLGLVISLFLFRKLRVVAVDQLNVKRNDKLKERIVAVGGGVSYILCVYVYPIIVLTIIGLSFYFHRLESLEWILINFMLLWFFLFADIIANEVFLKLEGSAIVSTTIMIEFYIKSALTIAYVVLSVRAEAYSVVYNDYKYLKHVKVVIGDKSIATSSVYRYIGKTKSYIFFYDILKGSADIVSLDDVKSFTILESEPHINKPYKDGVTPAKDKVVKDSVKQIVEKDTVRTKLIADTVKPKIFAKDSVKNPVSIGSKK